MGAVISGPLTALGTCLGSTVGGCLATGCCKLAGSGNVDSAYAARCVMLWLQAFTALLAWLASATPEHWLPWTCEKLDGFGIGDVGVCACHSKSDRAACWSEQLVYRAEASAVVVFAGLFLMAISGCAKGAARSHSVAKFMLVLLLGVVSLFFPNGLFTAFGAVSTTLAAVYLAAQAILLIDFAYSWNELWFSNAQAQQRDLNPTGYRGWLAAVLASAGLLFVASVVLCVYLYTTTPMAAARIVVLLAMLVAFVLLIVSILDWCEHGALLTSCVVMLYTMWLAYEALAVLPDNRGPSCPTWVGLVVCCVSLVSFAQGAGLAGSTAEASSPLSAAERGAAAPGRGSTTELAAGGATAAEAGSSAATGGAEDEESAAGRGGDTSRLFALQCAVHAAAAFYVAASLAPQAGSFTFASHVAAVFVALALYGWSLVAPKVLTGRNFN